jgi:FkbM family methyltransferase
MAFYRTLAERLLTTRVKPQGHKVSFSQCGEDLIAEYIFSECLRLPEISYLDIGAYHPTLLSNTYLFYQKGHRGVCIEPDPDLLDGIKSVRPEDTCLNVGVGTSQQSRADFYRMTNRTLNTFSKDAAERYQEYGNQKIEEVISMPLLTVDSIIERYFNFCPHYISLDIEGLDFEILKTFDFSRFRPQVFCVETLTYTEDKSERKLSEIIELVTSNNYFVYADTYINTIFVERDSWLHR